MAQYKVFGEQYDDEKSPQVRIKLLDDFTAQNPDWSLIPPTRTEIYTLYFLTYFSLHNYPQAVAYTDKLLADADFPDEGRLSVLASRAAAYGAGCNESAFLTPEASAKAKEAASQGLQLLGRFPKPPHLTDAEFTAEKSSYGAMLTSEAKIAVSRLKGEPVVCVPPPSPFPPPLQRVDRYDRIMQDLGNER